MPIAGGIIRDPKSIAANRVEIRGVEVGHNDVAEPYKGVHILVVPSEDLVRLIQELVSPVEVLRDVLVDLVNVYVGHEGVSIHDSDEGIVQIDPIFQEGWHAMDCAPVDVAVFALGLAFLLFMEGIGKNPKILLKCWFKFQKFFHTSSFSLLEGHEDTISVSVGVGC